MEIAVALPKIVFENRFSVDFINENIDKICFISILDVDNEQNKINVNSQNFLQVRMNDIEEDLYENGVLKYNKPCEKELQKIVDFINFHKDKKVCFVHCSAGISRSGAVVRYIKELYDIDKVIFIKYNPNIMPNLYILNKLKELYHVNKLQTSK